MKFSIILVGFVGMLLSVVPVFFVEKRLEELFENKTISNVPLTRVIYVVVGIVIFVVAGNIDNAYLRALAKGFGIGFAGVMFLNIDDK